MKKITVLLFVVVSIFSVSVFAEDVFKIEYDKAGPAERGYSKQELRKKVWELERAVWQLQQRVFRLEEKKKEAELPPDTWICTLTPFSKTYSATGKNRASATHKVIKACTAGESSGYHCRKPKCRN